MAAIAEPDSLTRYRRQITFDGLGLAGQRSLASGRALIVGMGGLGSWIAELLARGGVGFLRLVDSDTLELTNLHRQALYDEADVRASRPKVDAAAEHLVSINSAVEVDARFTRLDRLTIESLAGDMDVILDGTDNFATRFLINDFAVKTGRPWICAGVVGAEAQTINDHSRTYALPSLFAPRAPSGVRRPELSELGRDRSGRCGHRGV